MPTALNQTLIGPGTIDFGTCELAQTYGTVVSGSVKAANDEQVWESCRGNTEVVLLKNERFELTMEVLFNGTLPDVGDDIAFPEVSVTGQIVDFEITWAQGDRKKLKLNAKHWKSLGSSPTVTSLTTG